MMQPEPELLHPTWPLFYNIPCAYSSLDSTELCGFPMVVHMADADNSDFSTFLSTQDPSCDISLDTLFATMTPDNFIDVPKFIDDKEIMDSFSDECKWMDESDSEGYLSSELTFEGSADVVGSPPELKSSATASPLSNMNLRLPGNDDIETDGQLVLHHLLTAYGEAMGNDQKELMEVIVKRVNSRIDPLGDPIERLAFNLFQSAENQSGYLRQQSSKNFEAAHKVFYEWFPYGRFAHFTANSAILEAIPKDAEIIHIVDFDMRDGVQWPPMIEAIGRKGQALRLTSIKPSAEGGSGDWKFHETKHRLYNHARSLGLSLRVEEMSLRELETEIKSKKMRSGGKDWLAFNCMVGLPHMRNRSDVTKFVRVAKELLAYNSTGIRRTNAGILTFGDGETGEDLETGVGSYNRYFNSQLMHFQALLESMERSDFPAHLIEARLAMESLFVAPDICADSWLEQWKHSRVEDQGVKGLEGKRISKESLNEAKELVNEKASSYKVNIRGEKRNELVLEWKGTSLVRVSSWM